MRIVQAKVVEVVETHSDVQRLRVRYPLTGSEPNACLRDPAATLATKDAGQAGAAASPADPLPEPAWAAEFLEADALNYLALNTACTPGDTVLVNTTGIDLGLGTGSLAFVLPERPLSINLPASGSSLSPAPKTSDTGGPPSNPSLLIPAPTTNLPAAASSPGPSLPTPGSASPGAQDFGHIIKLRYTPLQREFATVEEQGSRYHELLRQAD